MHSTPETTIRELDGAEARAAFHDPYAYANHHRKAGNPQRELLPDGRAR